MSDAFLVFAVLAAALVLFIVERWRYDLVALAALLTLTLAGVIPAGQAFSGFANPAVVTVAAVLVVSRGLSSSGLAGVLSALLARLGPGETLQVVALTGMVSVCSAFMNDVGALALLLPVAIRLAQRHDRPPSLFLMPLAFGSLLGGMTTLVGTPPNLLVASFRPRAGEAPFRMFDFSRAGVPVAVAGLAFVALVGWRLLPRRRAAASLGDLFRIADYTAELVVPEGSRLDGKPLRSLPGGDGELVVVGLERSGRTSLAPSAGVLLSAGDRLIVEADPEGLQGLLEGTGLELAAGREPLSLDDLRSEEVQLLEVVVLPDSALARRTPSQARLRGRFGLNLLGVARQGSRLRRSLREVRLLPGDVLLVQAQEESLPDLLESLGLLPLAERELRLGQRRRLPLALGIFGAAVACLAFGLLPVQVAFVAAALAMVLTGVVDLQETYRSIDWPVLVLLGAMIPVAHAVQTTGGAALISHHLARWLGGAPPAVAVGALLLVTMSLTNVMNNAATAVVMSPIALSLAAGLGASADPFLMAVAVGASCAFLSPIGHQSNTLVMGPGGYRFGDYWRMGLPLGLLIAAVAVPAILWAWPP